MIVKLLTEHHLVFLSIKGGCRGSSESTHIKMPHCWKSHALAQMSCFIVQFSNEYFASTTVSTFGLNTRAVGWSAETSTRMRCVQLVFTCEDLHVFQNLVFMLTTQAQSQLIHPRSNASFFDIRSLESIV